MIDFLKSLFLKDTVPAAPQPPKPPQSKFRLRTDPTRAPSLDGRRWWCLERWNPRLEAYFYEAGSYDQEHLIRIADFLADVPNKDTIYLHPRIETEGESVDNSKKDSLPIV